MAGRARNVNTSFEVAQQKINADLNQLISNSTNLVHGAQMQTPLPTGINKKPMLLSGGVFAGAVGHNHSIVEIAAGVINIGQSTDKFAGIIIVQAETGVADTLSSINNQAYPNQQIKIIADTGDTITVDSADNIVLSASIELTANSYLPLMYNDKLNKWLPDVGIGGGVTDPIRLGLDTPTLQTAPAVTNLDIDSFTEFNIVLDRNIKLALTGTLPVDKTQGLTIKITQDAATKFTIDWDSIPLSTVPADPALSEINIVFMYSNDQGVSWQSDSFKGGTGAGFSGNLSALTIDANKDWATKSITNMAAIQYVDVGAAIRGSISGDSGSSAIRLATASAGKFIISDVIIDIAEFTNAGGLKMFKGINVNSQTLSNTGNITYGAATFDQGDATNPLDQLFVKTVRLQTGLLVTNKPTATSLTGNTFDINFPTGSTFNIHENGTSKHTFSATSLNTPNIILSDTLNISDSSVNPTLNGQFTRNSTDVKVFSGGAVRNLSDIGSGANQQLDNLVNPRPNVDILANRSTGGNLGSTTAADVFLNMFSDKYNIGGSSTRQIALSGNDIRIRATSGNDIIFTEDVTDWMIMDGGTNTTRMLRELDMSGNNISKVAVITSNAANPADTGFIRMGNAETLVWEANPSGVDVTLQVNSSNDFEFSGALIPNGTRTLGLIGTRWNSAFLEFLNVSNNALFNGDVFLGDTALDNIHFAGEINTNFIPNTDDSFDLGSTTKKWRSIWIDGTATIDTLQVDLLSTFNGQANFNASVVLGNAVSDLILPVGRFNASLIPSTSGTRDLGTSSLLWRDIYAQQIRHTSANTNIQLSTSGININATDTGDDIILHAGDDLILRVTGSSDLISFSDGGDRIHYEFSNDDLSPLDNIASLGKSGRRWVDVWAVNGTIQTSFTTFKCDIHAVDTHKSLDVCNALKPILYKWKEEHLKDMKPEKKKEYLGKTHMGFNADALKTMCPNSVAGDDGVYQGSIIGHLLGAVQELTKKIKKLENK